MTPSPRGLTTRKGEVPFPAYIPVTTFGEKYPLDNLVRPFLPRLAPAVLVSYHYMRSYAGGFPLPLMIDSGGFAALLEGSRVVQSRQLGILEVRRSDGIERVHPSDVLELQEMHADVAFSLDFPIPPSSSAREVKRRIHLTLSNAVWALENKRRRDLPLYACIPSWDVDSAAFCARSLSGAGFDGVAIGGLVPRARNVGLVREIVSAVRDEIGPTPLHVFGLGSPRMVATLFQDGVDSVDSSSFLQAAAQGRLWSNPHHRISRASPVERLHLALCNLAAATGRPLPLSTLGITFDTVASALQGSRSSMPSPQPVPAPAPAKRPLH